MIYFLFIHDLFFIYNFDSFYLYTDFYRNRKSNIDLIRMFMDITDKINVKIHDQILDSDHYPIFTRHFC